MNTQDALVISSIAQWLVTVVTLVLLIGLIRATYQLLQRTPDGPLSSEVGLRHGQIAPPFSGRTLKGELVNSGDFANQIVGLLFVSPSCPSCTATLYELDSVWKKSQGSVVVICCGPEAPCRELADIHQPEVRIVLDEGSAIKKTYGISSFPTAVLLVNNRIRSYGGRHDQIQEMVREASAQQAQDEIINEEVTAS